MGKDSDLSQLMLKNVAVNVTEHLKENAIKSESQRTTIQLLCGNDGGLQSLSKLWFTRNKEQFELTELDCYTEVGAHPFSQKSESQQNQKQAYHVRVHSV